MGIPETEVHPKDVETGQNESPAESHLEPDAPESNSKPLARPKVSSLRLNIITAGLWISLFLAALDSTIVTTALISISNEFNSLSKSAWIVISYLLTFNAFLLLLAKLSDIFGLKMMLISCNIIFLIFSIACAFAQTMSQLIVFRAFQGIGGSGLVSLVFVVIMKLVSLENTGIYSGVISSVFTVANLLGPILGGVITEDSTWRWIFRLNGPGVGLALLVLIPAMPNTEEKHMTKAKFARIDVVGGFLSVAWPVLLVFALQEGDSMYPWSSAAIISTLVLGSVGFIVFVSYESWLERSGKQEAIFPIRVLKDPVTSLTLLSSFLMGFIFYSAIIELPQRFQAVNGASPAHAGVLLLPLTLLSPAFTFVAGALMGKKPQTVPYTAIFSTTFMLIGTALVSTLPTSHTVSPKQHGYQVILGAGLGLMNPILYYLVKNNVSDRDLASTTGALNSLRTLGGMFGLATCSAILHRDLRNDLQVFLPQQAVEALTDTLTALDMLDAAQQERVRVIYGESYNRQFKVQIAFAALGFATTIALFVAIKKQGRGALGLPETVEETAEVVKQGEKEEQGQRSEVATPATFEGEFEKSPGTEGEKENDAINEVKEDMKTTS